MKILFGIMCLAIWYRTTEPLEILRSKSNDPFSSQPSEELGMFCIHWITFICGIVLIIIGVAGLIKRDVKK